VALEAFCLLRLAAMLEGSEAEREKPRVIFQLTEAQSECLDTIRLAAYPPKGKEKSAMKLPRNALIWCVLIVCLTLLIFTFLTRKSLCEIRYKDGTREVAAFMAYESDK
jgi:protein HokB